MAQPNFGVTHQALVDLADQVALLPNIPALNQPQIAQDIQQLLQQTVQMQQQMQQQNTQMLQTLAQINQTLVQIDQQLQNM